MTEHARSTAAQKRIDDANNRFYELSAAALTKARSKDAATRLLALMSDLSELHWCAGWLYDLEHLLWNRLEPDASLSFGLGQLSTADVQQLRDLAALAGGWWIWWEDPSDAYCSGNLFVTTEEWLAMREART